VGHCDPAPSILLVAVKWRHSALVYYWTRYPYS